VHVPLSKNVIKAKAETEVLLIDLHFSAFDEASEQDAIPRIKDKDTPLLIFHSELSKTHNTPKMSSGKQIHSRTDQADKAACCKLPPVEAEYSPKGSYEKINGYKTYVTGPEDSDKAIVAIYDIFGFSPQILQGVSSLLIMDQQLISGADLLSSTGARVYMPDFLKGEYATAEMFSGSEE